MAINRLTISSIAVFLSSALFVLGYGALATATAPVKARLFPYRGRRALS